MTTIPVVKIESYDYVNGVLPANARRNFDQIRTLLSEKDNSNNNIIDNDSLPSHSRSTVPIPSIQLQKRRRLQELAVDTAIIVENEISHWLKGIAEMEAMLFAVSPATKTSTSLHDVVSRSETKVTFNQQLADHNGAAGAGSISNYSHGDSFKKRCTSSSDDKNVISRNLSIAAATAGEHYNEETNVEDK
eukprot:CAMPEP_0195522174 /NCGR_PEP_ID=MMETSP0794_2-20130614/20084_1 /TAXON_ID=515487 /ORGANISM="Stephanopyxis turris, Strain CCMP 815" /LENGTH=189 /DNA_ID=CAMNT_0040651865 /DNA_START=621 /DNA_END=1190 /DNA_ORIENTATION=+